MIVIVHNQVVRSCSVDSAAWVLSMQDPNTSASERLEKLRKAVNSHVSYMNQAVEGLGCDRLILGSFIQAITNDDDNQRV